MSARDLATQARDLSLKIYKAGRDYARQRGIIIADTKFEFGLFDGKLILIDEVLTPDSSRFWPADQYAPGKGQPSFDKQFVRDYLETLTGTKPRPARNCRRTSSPKPARNIWRRMKTDGEKALESGALFLSDCRHCEVVESNGRSGVRAPGDGCAARGKVHFVSL